jgi:hypothetical protein
MALCYKLSAGCAGLQVLGRLRWLAGSCGRLRRLAGSCGRLRRLGRRLENDRLSQEISCNPALLAACFSRARIEITI